MSKKTERLDKTKLKEALSPLAYTVTQECGTEPPFANAYWNHKGEGIYVDVVNGEPLFSSRDKFDSDTGWPSFTRPIVDRRVVVREDRAHGMTRAEVRSKEGDSHLGHVFPDGPAPTGLRFCINSASLRFIPVEKLEEEGYGDSLALFSDSGKRETATLAGGCFWGMEHLLRALPGIVETTVGYTGGALEDPSYEDICGGDTGHAEAIDVVYDPAKTSYEEILNYFFRIHDPTTLNRQGHDAGTQYRSAIFYHSEAQKNIAEKVKAELNRSGKWKQPIVTEIAPAQKFYSAEDYHQDYLQKNPGGYSCHYVRPELDTLWQLD